MSSLISAGQFDATLQAINRPTHPEQYPLLLQAIKDAGISSRAELALFLANIYHESEGLQYVAEIGGGAGKGYEGGDQYYGRGYIQLTHIYNYHDASAAIFGDSKILEKNPERVEREHKLAWDVTAWFWRARVKPGGVGSLEETVRSINSMELNGYHPALERRYEFFHAISAVLGVGSGLAPSVKKSLHTPHPTGSVYTVQPGDSLWEIGKKLGVSYHQIASDNNIKDPALIHPGMKLTIGTSQSSAPNTQQNAQSGTGQVYVVKAGDSLWEIGKRYGVSHHQIATDNNIRDPALIHPGMKLVISGSQAKSTDITTQNSASTGEGVYVVKPGDSLWEIGQKYGVSYHQIASDNNIRDPALIHPGMKLVIKGSQKSAPQETVSANSDHSLSRKESVHIVQPGDTLYAIGQKYGVPYLQIASDNNIADPNVIFPGMKLRIGDTQGQHDSGTEHTTRRDNSGNRETSGSGRKYSVKPGDSLWEIGQKHGVDFHRIAEVNKIADATKIFPGQILNIP